MTSNKSALLGRLKRAVEKVKFLLSFNSTKWILSSIIRSSSPTARRLSFKSQPSLLNCTEDYYSTVGSSFGSGVSRTTSLPSDMSRSVSSVSAQSDASSAEDDIDKRADIFIANFYKHIQMERQVSLDLRYCKEGL